MRNTSNMVFLSVMTPLLLAGCGDDSIAIAENPTQQTMTQLKRWYSQDQVERGNPLYQSHCAVCHKPDASGTKEWNKLDANGKLPPPPLNGSAHTWHHPLSILRRTVIYGGIPLGGTMPAFGDKLTPQQIYDILAWVQSHWSDEIYKIWNQRNSMANNRTGSG